MMQSTFQQSAAALFLLPPALSCKTREISTCVSIQSPVSQVGKCALAERKLRSPERAVRAGKDSPTRPARRSSWARAASWRWPRTSCGGHGRHSGTWDANSD